MAKETPGLAKQLEGYFPGATFIFLGRDMYLLFQALYWLYREAEPSERIKHLGFSKETALQLDCRDLLDYLQQKGLHFPPKDHPWVFIDTISYGKGRQGKAILNCLYTEGSSEQDPFLAFVGLPISTTPSGMVALEDQHHLHGSHQWSRQRKEIPKPEPLMAHLPREAAEAGYTHQVGCFHGPYGPLKRTVLGIFETSGPPCSPEEQETLSTATKFLMEMLEKAPTHWKPPPSRAKFYPNPLNIVKERLPLGLPFKDFAERTMQLKKHFKIQMHWSYWSIFARYYASHNPKLKGILRWGPHHPEKGSENLQQAFRCFFEPETALVEYLSLRLTPHQLVQWFRRLSKYEKALFLKEALSLDSTSRHRVFIYSGLTQFLEPSWIQEHVDRILGPRPALDTLLLFIHQVPRGSELRTLLLKACVGSALNMDEFEHIPLPPRPWEPALQQAVMDFFLTQGPGSFRAYLQRKEHP
jgi:hypothetical protein